jgi:hypothetical protein
MCDPTKGLVMRRAPHSKDTVTRPRSFCATHRDRDAVVRFIDRLATFQPNDWLDAADAAAHDTATRARARVMIDMLIARHGLAVQAWGVLDDIQTVAHRSRGPAWFVSPSGRTATRLRRARDAADAAGLALLVRPWLPEHEFDVLYRPFAARARSRDDSTPLSRAGPLRALGTARSPNDATAPRRWTSRWRILLSRVVRRSGFARSMRSSSSERSDASTVKKTQKLAEPTTRVDRRRYVRGRTTPPTSASPDLNAHYSRDAHDIA